MTMERDIIDTREELTPYVEKYSQSLQRKAIGLTRNRADAEDLVQTALTEIWDHLVHKGQIEKLNGYVQATMVNTNISSAPRRDEKGRLREHLTDDPPEQSWEDHGLTRTDLRHTIRRALDQLSKRQRAVVMLRFYQDLTEARTAEQLNVTVGTVKTTASRALTTLRADDHLRQAWMATRRPSQREAFPDRCVVGVVPAQMIRRHAPETAKRVRAGNAEHEERTDQTAHPVNR
jgi:RNA polymerase sigma-70 factor (sigma-E family)